ncbi:MAG TPA: tetratricopeptide repeat protein [Kiritimatiellia bacterium]|jgi:tetratricopeptide (TPR) repeat protein
MKRWGNGIALLAFVMITGARAEDSAKTNAPTAMDQGFACVKTGDFASAVSHFQAALREDPNNRKAAVALGSTYQELGRDEDAVSVTEPVVAAEPENFIAKNNLAWILATSDDADVRDAPRGLQLAREALALAPRDFRVMSTVSEAEYASGHYEEALRLAESALKMASTVQGMEEHLSTYRAQVEKCRQALQAFELAE